MSYLRTPEHCRKRAELIRQWKPWEKSTGPKTDEGKATVANNAWKGGVRPMMRQLSNALREQNQIINEVASVRQRE